MRWSATFGRFEVTAAVVAFCVFLWVLQRIMGRTKRTTVPLIKSRSKKSSSSKSPSASTPNYAKSTTTSSSKSKSAAASASAETTHFAKRSMRGLKSNAHKARGLSPMADEDDFIFLDEEKSAAGGIASYFKKAVSGVAHLSWSSSSSSSKSQCMCSARNDALDSLVNSKQFSDVAFLVGQKAPEASDETKDETPPSTSSSSSSLSASTSSLDEDVVHTPTSSLMASNPKTARIYAIRGIVASSSDVFKAMFNGSLYEAQNEAAVIYVPDCSPRGFVTMLRYIYTNRPDLITVDNLVETMYCAHKYQVDSLLRLCSEYIKEHLSIENVCRFLLDCDVWVSAAFMKFISVHADEILASSEFMKLDKKKVMSIVESDSLSVTSEFQVFEAVYQWGARQLKKKRIEDTPENLREEVKELVALIRFPQMNLEELLDDVVPTGLLTEKEVFSIIMFWQTLGEHKCDFVSSPRLQRYINLVYEKDWDENGVIFFIGSKGGTESFTNPHNKGVVNKMSSRENGNEMMLTSRSASQLYTNSVQNSTIGFDIGEGRLLTPNYYTIRHGFSSANYYPRNWVFEGSLDGQTWDVLRKHTNDSKINSAQGSGSWKIDMSEVETKGPSAGGSEPKYRHFRVRNTGIDHSSSNYLMVCGMEVYGKLYTRERHSSMFRVKKKSMANNGSVPSGALFSRSGFGRR